MCSWVWATKGALTVSGLVQNDEAGVYSCSVLSGLPIYGVCMAANPVGGFVKEDIMVSVFESPYCSQPRTAAPDDGDPLPETASK